MLANFLPQLKKLQSLDIDLGWNKITEDGKIILRQALNEMEKKGMKVEINLDD